MQTPVQDKRHIKHLMWCRMENTRQVENVLKRFPNGLNASMTVGETKKQKSGSHLNTKGCFHVYQPNKSSFPHFYRNRRVIQKHHILKSPKPTSK